MASLEEFRNLSIDDQEQEISNILDKLFRFQTFYIKNLEESGQTEKVKSVESIFYFYPSVLFEWFHHKHGQSKNN